VLNYYRALYRYSFSKRLTDCEPDNQKHQSMQKSSKIKYKCIVCVGICSYTISQSAKNSNWVRLKVGQTSPTTIHVAWWMVKAVCSLVI